MTGTHGDGIRQEPASAPLESASVTTSPLAADLLLEDVSIDGMCGVY